MNHARAADSDVHINEFIQKECHLGAMLRPFDTAPFEPWCQVSPLMTRPKKNSSSRRVIIDLSFPVGGVLMQVSSKDSIKVRVSLSLSRRSPPSRIS